jgi:SAM-dependent methyltransferase
MPITKAYPDYDAYRGWMSAGLQKKMDFFVPRIWAILGKESSRILDIGCCSGDLVLGLKRAFPSHQFLWIDLDDSFIAEARERAQAEWIDAEFMCWDASQLHQIENGSIDTIILSSVIHELYSYWWDKFDKQFLKKVFLEFQRIMRSRWTIVGRDPAMPHNPHQKFKLEFPEQDTDNWGEIQTLSLLGKWKRFLWDFAPAQGQNADIGASPLWLINEFLRHIKFARSEERWAFELREQYGVMTEAQWREFIWELGFRVKNIQTSPLTESRIPAWELQLYNPRGKPVKDVEVLPRNIILELINP